MVTKPIWPNGRFGVPQITPYTARDAHSLLELIKAVRDHVVNELHPNLQSAIDQLVLEVEKEYGDALDQYVNGVQEFQRIHDAFMADVNAKLVALNDGAATDLVKDDTSLLGRVLRELFTSPSTIDDHVAALFDDESTHFAYELARRVTVYPKFFGARGDGVTDDTRAMQRWADSPHTALEPGAVYRITDGLKLTKSVDGNGATILLEANDTTNSVALEITGDDLHVDDVTIQGVGRNRGGIIINGDRATVTNNRVRDIWSDNFSDGIRVRTTNGGTKIANNVVYNLWAKDNGIYGDGWGACRGIALDGPIRNDMKPNQITGNHVYEIRGEEGDGIHVIFYTPGGQNNPYGVGNVNISNNTIEDCSRRFMKIQASLVEVAGNFMRQTRARNPQVHGFERPGWGVNIIQSTRVRFVGNILTWMDLNGGVNFEGSTDRYYHDIVIADNHVRGVPGEQGQGIYAANLVNSVIANNNVVNCSAGVTTSRSVSTVIQGNTIGRVNVPFTNLNLLRGVHVNSNCDKVAVVNNTVYESPDAVAFNNLATNSITQNNVKV